KRIDTIGFTDILLKIAVSYPGDPVVTPLRRPAVHDLEGAAIFAVIITNYAHGMAAQPYLRLVEALRLPKFFAHHILHKALSYHHADYYRRVFRKMLFYGAYVDLVQVIAFGKPGKAVDQVLPAGLNG